MTDELLDNIKGNNKETLTKRVINTFFCTLFISCILFCYGIFHSEPSLGYLVLLYVAFFMLILAIIQIILIKPKWKLWTGLITIGSTISLILAALNNAPNDVLMKVGQITAGVSFILSLPLFVFIWKNQRAEAMAGYNDDLVMSFAIGLWVRDTALRLKNEGIELQKKAINSIATNQGVYKPTEHKNDSWIMETGRDKESLELLIK